MGSAFILVGSGNLGYLLPFHLLLDPYVGQRTDRIFRNALGHLIKHVVSDHLILHLRISLSICLKADALAQLVHIIDMIHPFRVNDL